MTKTMHPLMSHYSSTKKEGRRGGGGAYSRGGAYYKFRPIEGALIRRGRLFEGGGGGVALIRRFTVYTNPEFII